MGKLFRDKYHIGSIRYKGYDYSSPGKYFVTFNTKFKVRYFGHIEDGKMVLSDSGVIARDCWMEIPEHFPFVKLDEFVIMPDHVHGIIIIESPIVESPKLGDSTVNFYWNSHSLGLIINQYKRACTIKIKMMGEDFAWQSKYYDHIIRTGIELSKIRSYIKSNPEKW
jgi:putative transposase